MKLFTNLDKKCKKNSLILFLLNRLSFAILVFSFAPITTNAQGDLGITILAPDQIAPGTAMSYTIMVSNSGPGNMTNAIVRMPASANFTASTITCTSGMANDGNSVCPTAANLTVANLQGAGGLVIPSIPDGGTVTLVVGGTAATVANYTLINKTATVTAASGQTDAVTSNDSSAYKTTIHDLVNGKSSVYAYNSFTSTANSPAIGPDGGSFNMVYSLASGPAIPGLGTSFTIPATYSDLINRTGNGVNYSWRDGGPLEGLDFAFALVPEVSLFTNLPAPNTAAYNVVGSDRGDNFFRSRLGSNTIDPLGIFDINIGAIPSLPALSTSLLQNSRLRLYGSYKAVLGSQYSWSSYVGPIAQPLSAGASQNTSILVVPFNNVYPFRFTAILKNGDTAPTSADFLAAGLQWANILVGDVTFWTPDCTITTDNPDSDGDGISNSCDLDDDNDGILDSVESPACFYTSAEANIISNVLSTFNGATGDPAAGTSIATLFNGNTSDGNPFNFAGSQTITPGSALFTISYPTNTVFSSLAVTQVASGMMPASRFGVLYGSTDESNYTAISAPAGVALNTATVTFNVTSTTPYRYYQIRYIGTVSGGNTTNGTLGTANIQEIASVMSANYIPSANPKPGVCTVDTDGDGITNHLDLDDDNDGCPDAIEGAGVYTTLINSSMPGGNTGATSGTYNLPVVQNLGNTVNLTYASSSYGVPTVAGTGQGLGTATTANPVLIAGTATANQTIPASTAPAALTLTGSTGSVQWEFSPNNSTFTSVTTGIGGATTSYSPGVLLATGYYRAVVTSAGGCTAISNVITITVESDSDGDGIVNIYDLDDDNDGILDSVECGGGAIYIYSGFGIRTVTGGANLIGFTGPSYAPSTIATNILGTADVNHIATDASRNRILFANNVGQGSLFAYQFSTNTVVNLGAAFLSSLGDSSGGAGMYNGDYFIYDDTGTNEGLWRVTFNSTGNASALTKVAEPPAGGPDLGDMAINHSGMVYITSNGNLHRLDLNSLNLSTTAPASAWTTINTNSPISGSQLFFASNGDLIGSTSSGNLVRVNPSTGANLGTVSTLTNSYSWGDLSEAPTVGFSCGTDTDGDGIPNSLDLDSDNDGCPDAIEGASTVINNSNLVNSSMPGGNIGATSGSYNQPVIQNLGNIVDTNSASATYGVPTIAGVGQAIGTSQNNLINSCICYEDPSLVAGATYPVKHGITVLGRAGSNIGDWPTLRNSAYTVLESKTKGFVITRNSSPETTIAIPVVGMVVFDTDENAGAGCMKIYIGSGAGEGWKCFNTQGCP